MNGLTVRRAVESDSADIARAESAYIDCPWTEDQIRAEISDSQAAFFVAEIDGAFAGYLSGVIAADECEVSNIAVIERFRRRKVGTELFAALVESASTRGVKSLYLLVRADNSAAIGLYRSLGFEVVGVRKRYYDGDDANIMRLDLKSS